MVQHIVESFNLELAWKRVVRDFTDDRVFVKHPYQLSLIEIDEQHLLEWLEAFRVKCLNHLYSPHPMLICEIPKPGNTVRPGGLLDIEDHLFYTACVGTFFPQIQAYLGEVQPKIEFSYPLAKNADKPGWLDGYFRAYKAYDEDSLKKLSEVGYSHIIFTDITGYYENIDLGILHSDLNQIGAPANIASELRNALKIWSQVSISGRGVPQGYSASDILAKLYLHQIDIAFQSLGYVHVRWVDDFRIFCHSEAEARQAIIALSQLLRKRGLNLQSGKTEILSASDAEKRIKGISPILENVREQYINEIREVLDIGTISYLPRIEELYAASEEEAPIELIQMAYNQYFMSSVNGFSKFDKTLFRFLLARFRIQNSDYAVAHCLQYIVTYPSETDTILKYLGEIGKLSDSDIQEFLATFMTSDYAVYDYQIYQIYAALNNVSLINNHDLISFARKCTFDNNRPAYLRAVCRKFLSNHGTLVDVDRIQSQYAYIGNELEQCEIIMAMHRMEKSKRNSFIISVQERSILHKRAAKLLKDGRI